MKISRFLQPTPEVFFFVAFRAVIFCAGFRVIFLKITVQAALSNLLLIKNMLLKQIKHVVSFNEEKAD